MAHQCLGEAENVTLHDLLESVDFRITAREVLEYELGLVRDFVAIFAQVVTPFDAHQVYLHMLCDDVATIAAANEFIGTLVVHIGLDTPFFGKVEEATFAALFAYLEITNRSDVLSKFVTHYLGVFGSQGGQILADICAIRRSTLQRVTRLTKDPRLKEKVRLLEMIDYPRDYLISLQDNRNGTKKTGVRRDLDSTSLADCAEPEKDSRSTATTLPQTTDLPSDDTESHQS